MHFDSQFVQILCYVLAGIAAVILLTIGFYIGRGMAGIAHRRVLAGREQELFTAQRGFKTLYEQEASTLKTENHQLKSQLLTKDQQVEDYRKKAAGFGGLFSRGRRSEAMYALLLENEALEDALHIQNEKLRQERVDAVKEQMRATGYRRILISQLLNDRRIKNYIAEVSAQSPDTRALAKPAEPEPPP